VLVIKETEDLLSRSLHPVLNMRISTKDSILFYIRRDLNAQ